MNLKESLYIPASLIPTSHQNQLQNEEKYLARLKEALQWVAGSLEANAREIEERYIRREECDRLLEEKQQAISALQTDNYQLRVTNQQYQRYLKRYEMKHKLFNSKIEHLTKTVAQKDAIIKYLEGKTTPAPTQIPAILPLPTPTARPLNDSLRDRAYSKPNISFAKLKSTHSLLTFEDYANCSLQLPSDPTKRIKGDRVRTESSDVKENESIDNIRPQPPVGKPTGFFTTSMFGNVQNQKTLTKAHSTTAQQNASFWQYSRPNQESREQRRHSNFSNACIPHGIYRD